MRPGTGLASTVSPAGSTNTRTDADAAAGAAADLGGLGAALAAPAALVWAETVRDRAPRNNTAPVARQRDLRDMSVNIQPGFEFAKIGIECRHEAGFVHRSPRVARNGSRKARLLRLARFVFNLDRPGRLFNPVLARCLE